MNFTTIAVLGAGAMGSGIAQLLAQYGFTVNLCDKNPQILRESAANIRQRLDSQAQRGHLTEDQLNSARSALQTVQSLSEACTADLIIEAVPEQIELKKNLFAEIDRAAPANAFLASNTSGLDIDQLAAATERAERVIGMHFFNPPPRMPLVEIARGKATSDATFDAVHTLARQLGKTPISVSNSPAFAVNRILFPMINEAIYALAEGVASAKDIDRAMCLGADHPLGPLALADFVGLDITLDILDALERDLESDKYRACPLLRDKVARGELGRKTGRGFFSYS